MTTFILFIIFAPLTVITLSGILGAAMRGAQEIKK